MVKKNKEQLWVWLDSAEFGPLQRIGILSKGDRGSISFAYHADWLEHVRVFPLDPELDLTAGEFYPANGNFGVFLDSCPDRWGQTLMERREAIEAQEGKRVARTLGPWDFLLGVQDCTRMGALRFSRPDDDTFLADEALSAPPVTSLAELQVVAFELSKNKQDDLDLVKKWLQVLVAPGSSLGGARPKANVLEKDGEFWIAKFPAADDDYDVAAWEKVLHDMAGDCGVDVPKSRIEKIGNKYHTFLVERFDRRDNQRVFFISGMAALNREDSNDASYIDLAEFLSTYGDPDFCNEDLEQLYLRVVFNVATGNRDDHLRNHGFIRNPQGWRLAPAYDMNPSFKKAEHILTLDMHNNQPDLKVALETAEYYGVNKARAIEIVDRVCGVVSEWDERAQKVGISRFDRLMAERLFIVDRPGGIDHKS